MNSTSDARNLAAAGTQPRDGRVRMTAGEAFVETLVAHSIKDIFGIAGADCLEVLDLFPGAGIRFVSATQEQNAVRMADGYARVTDRPGVCITQNGSGIAAAVDAAYRAGSPLVVVTPEIPGNDGIPESHQFPGITACHLRVDSPLRIAELMHRAFAIASHERKPVQVGIRRDYLYGEGDYEILTPVVIERAAGATRSLDRAVRMLADADYPVIVSGGGMVTADGMEDVKALAEHLTAPVVNAGLRNDSFPASHPLACGPLGPSGSKAATTILARADVVLALGAGAKPFGQFHRDGLGDWPGNATIIQVDADNRALALANGVSLAIEGDPRLAAQELARRLKARGTVRPDRARLAEVRLEKEAWANELANRPSPNRKGRVGPRRALAALGRALPKSAMVAVDVGSTCALAGSYLLFEQPQSFLAAMAAGDRGGAFAAAIGARLARPDRPAIAYVGDGAWGMSLGEIMTCVREKIPAVAVVFNNDRWGTEKKGQADYFDSRLVAAPTHPDFSEVARVMGAEGYRVDHEDEVGDALKAAVKAGKPAVVEIMLAQEPGDSVHRDASRAPRRLLPKYRKQNGTTNSRR